MTNHSVHFETFLNFTKTPKLICRQDCLKGNSGCEVCFAGGGMAP